MTGSTILLSRVLPHFYRDSVALMAIASLTEKREGIVRVGAVMATPSNLGILAESDMLPDGLTAAPDDLIFVVRGTDIVTVTDALDAAEAALTAVDQGSSTDEQRPGTIREGMAVATGAERPANLATLSIAGTYAPIAAEQALREGLHVLCFSDNVDIADELRLKRLAIEKRLLMMGPDCGTAIIDGVPLGFANVVARGSVGIVAASGTGAQEVSRLLDSAGAGVSQLIGVGGRDLSADIGGLMANLALDFLVEDATTTVILVVSKPPATEVATALLARLATIAAGGTPVVACFLGQEDSDRDGVVVRGTLEGGALAAAALAGHPFTVAELDVHTAPPGRILGLYTGGTLASESKIILKRAGVEAEIIDLGDDEFTAGKPHPMIDPESRAQRIAAAGADETVGTILLDLVLGYGANLDPAGPVAAAVTEARAAARAQGRDVVVVGSVCGTASDPQGLARQRGILTAAGVIVAETNASAARLVAAAQVASASTNTKGDLV
jgi:FdrA protein